VPLDAVPDPRAGDATAAPADAATDVLAALRGLPTEQAAAVVLVDVEGMPVREAAAVLEVPEGTVTSHCARGRAALAALLSRTSADEGTGT
jgi:RNA polymerase sigma-70 factor (ECF subfamily)